MIIFKKTLNPDNEFDRTNVTFEIPDNDISLPDLREEFDDFLEAIGYSLPVED